MVLHKWLKEEDSDGKFRLLYRKPRVAASAKEFHLTCANKGPTIIIIETTDGFIVGGYTSTSWTQPLASSMYYQANKAFLFVLSGEDILSPSKMKLKNPKSSDAVRHHPSLGPAFDAVAHDLYVNFGSDKVYLNFGHTYL